MIRPRLKEAEWREAKHAGLPVIPVRRKGAIFGGMLAWLENIRTGSLPFFTASGEAKAPVNRVAALFCLLLALVILAPGPFTNVPPGIAIALFGFAMAERDGLLDELVVMFEDTCGNLINLVQPDE